MSIPMLNLLTTYPQWQVLEYFKLLDHYWDCCIVGHLMQVMFTKVLDVIVYIFVELVKFGLVLLLTYAIASLIFRWLDHLGNSDAAPVRPSFTRTSQGERASYPFVVDIPIHKLASSEKLKNSKSKEKGKDKDHDRPSTGSVTISPKSSSTRATLEKVKQLKDEMKDQVDSPKPSLTKTASEKVEDIKEEVKEQVENIAEQTEVIVEELKETVTDLGAEQNTAETK